MKLRGTRMADVRRPIAGSNADMFINTIYSQYRIGKKTVFLKTVGYCHKY